MGIFRGNLGKRPHKRTYIVHTAIDNVVKFSLDQPIYNLPHCTVILDFSLFLCLTPSSFVLKKNIFCHCRESNPGVFDMKDAPKALL